MRSVPSARGRAALLAATAVAACIAGPAWAQARDFAIPAQSAVTAIPEFARQAGVQILVAEGAVQGARTSAVNGSYSVEEGLRRLLLGAGLEVASNDGRTITLRRASVPQVVSAGEGAEPTAVDELIVTAQKKEERLQDVPIAISAFSQQSLEAQKIEGGFDLVKAVPNVTFSKSNYSSYNFSIRGIGTKAVSATSDPGVAISFNNVALIRNRLFEQEYFDIERIEVLRGPQGTLYGRNATGGVVNMITAKPEFDTFHGSIKAEVGNYDSRRLVGTVNVPLGDMLAVRLAGSSTERSGYGTNLATGEDVDGRDLWSSRLSVSFEPADWFRADFIWEHFEEGDNRLRTGKQLCHRDEGPESVPGVDTLSVLVRGRLSQGCKPGSLYSKDAFGAPNGLSIPFVIAAQMVAQLGFTQPEYLPDDTYNPNAVLVPFMKPGIDPYGVEQSRDLRTISSIHDADYRASADILALNVDIDLTDSLTLTSQTLYNEDKVYSFQDYNRFATVPTFNSSAGLYNFYCASGFQHMPEYNCSAPEGLSTMMPGGIFTDPQIGPANTLSGFEISSSESQQYSQDFRLQSSFSGPLNFSIGANYTEFKGQNDYYLFFNVVTLLAQGFYNRSPIMGGCAGGSDGLAGPEGSGAGGGCMIVDPNPIGKLDGDGHNYFRNKNPYKLESKAVFGELYWQAASNLKITGGLRFTDDRKSFTPWRSQLLVMGFNYGPGDPVNQRWTEVTGRLGLDWRPELSFTDDTMVYAFYSHGYKGGGANPPTAVPIDQSLVVAEHPAVFKPEFIDAFEIGAKNTLLGGSLMLNASAFYYDYADYQVSKVVDRTIVNENFDAKVWGFELESVWRPTESLRLNATVGYLDTRISDGEQSIDIFDRTQGRDGWMVMTPWIQQTSNCVLPTEVVAFVVNAPLLPPRYAAFSPLFQACKVWADETGLPGLFNRADYPEANNGAGFAADLSGNELPNAPHWTFAVGAEYRWTFGDGAWEATLRGDYYRQTDSFARVYNTVSDRLRGWDNANFSLRIARPADDLTFEIYAKNVFDETPITDAFLNSDSTGMTTNVFTLDPRLIGVSVTKGF
ncbi:TonB-dependent receptor [Caulobacter mirabilis]|uniref:TonB-denpendent receptor n=1 Tax=Caulobacter mirabilis TaxID=69666 RepID=A0A2D2AU24_9CAUL|nr:TonB-dependent receptor [Caulobacter mirabilis]ATQ41508.1 TonB-denpendent receptor [Caulobacter mirabilis]